jgi:hypothetical protein
MLSPHYSAGKKIDRKKKLINGLLSISLLLYALSQYSAVFPA